ncbi:MAG: DNRLRE domain-containing protein, partial [Clostridia bacterium]|nr:DNRLRE domain-containing protein [Clostridia bacterium]
MKKRSILKTLLMALLLAPMALMSLPTIAKAEAPMSKDRKYADFVGYQVTKPSGDTFSLCAILGVNDTAFNRVGMEIMLITKDQKDNIHTETYATREKEVYDTLFDGEGKTYDVKTDLGYEYAAALTLENLPLSPENDYLEIVVRPYVLGMNGIRAYGRAAVLSYNGELGEDGYPKLARKEAGFQKVYATDDTFIFNLSDHATSDFGDSAILQIKNLDQTDRDPQRAAYYKFHFTPELVKAIDTAASVKLRIAVQNIESKAGTTLYDAMFHATDAAWDEHTLNYQNHEELAKTRDLLGYAKVEDDLYMTLDITNYIREEMLNEDGSLTVSFRVTTEGYEDARLVYLHSKETKLALKPYIEIVGTLYDRPLDLEQAKNEGYEPFGYAEHLVNEWFDDLKQKIRPIDENGNPYDYDIDDYDTVGYGASKATGDFSLELPWTQNPWTPNGISSPSSWTQNRFARTLSTLGTSTANEFLDSEYAKTTSEYDIYGGIANAGFTGEETGFFHIEEIEGRPYIIDPLGNPYFAVGMNDVAFTSGTQNQEKIMMEKYGSQQAFFEEVTAELKAIGINTAQMSATSSILAVENGLSVVVPLGANSAYMNSLGRGYLSGDGIFPYNNTV